VQDVAVTSEGIRLGQFLKLAGIVDSGSDVKDMLAQTPVTVNGEPETRRGRQLRGGDVVRVGNDDYRVAL
jgi:ribosome-associated protein